MPTLLVVDDDRTDREAVRRCLADFPDLEILEADEGRAGLELLTEHRPDVVLTDLRMPGMNGLELVEHLREEEPRLPVMLMTSMGNERIAVEALQAGAASYVPKRDLGELLADTVQDLLQMAEARRDEDRLAACHRESRTEFELPNDPTLIVPLANFFSAALERIGFGAEADRRQVAVAISEAVTNAMVHGNLEVGSGLREKDRVGFDRLVVERRRLSPYKERRVRCVASLLPAVIEYRVSDEGPGFDTTSLPDPTDAGNLLKASGRGIFLMRTFMDEVEYNEVGNEVVLRKRSGANAAGADRERHAATG